MKDHDLIQFITQQPAAEDVRRRHSQRAAKAVAEILDEFLLAEGLRVEPRAYRRLFDRVLGLFDGELIRAAARELHTTAWHRKLGDSPFAIALRRWLFDSRVSLRDESANCRWSHVAISKAGERLQALLRDRAEL